ncbi:SDR family NAD(P)-dependent oxidoreductase [Paenarthrobacter ilicis]|uniref:SDR family oxidoreductase n=1 Tax=Paenarthrobacter ilicis TaxID=43665 RepID=UPI0028D06EEB|nr:SDR family NAD(P)-dependent oxidoreductase [Paenarthrobacter ilicis]
MSHPMNDRPVAVITGAGGGLGNDIADRLADDGFDLALLDVSEPALKEAATRLNDRAPQAKVLTLTGNLADEAVVAEVFARIEAEFGRIDALVSAAGGSGTAVVRELSELSGDVWRSVIESNLTSTFLCARHAVTVMLKRGYGRIVNFSSLVADGFAGPSGTVGARLAYAASKGGIVSLTKQLGKDLGGTGITVNAVAPGLILPTNGRVRDSFESMEPQERAATSAAIPVGRPGTGHEIAAAVAYLVSDAAAFTSGTVLHVDGAAS